MVIGRVDLNLLQESPYSLIRLHFHFGSHDPNNSTRTFRVDGLSTERLIHVSNALRPQPQGVSLLVEAAGSASRVRRRFKQDVSERSRHFASRPVCRLTAGCGPGQPRQNPRRSGPRPPRPEQPVALTLQPRRTVPAIRRSERGLRPRAAYAARANSSLALNLCGLFNEADRNLGSLSWMNSPPSNLFRPRMLAGLPQRVPTRVGSVVVLAPERPGHLALRLACRDVVALVVRPLALRQGQLDLHLPLLKV